MAKQKYIVREPFATTIQGPSMYFAPTLGTEIEIESADFGQKLLEGKLLGQPELIEMLIETGGLETKEDSKELSLEKEVVEEKPKRRRAPRKPKDKVE